MSDYMMNIRTTRVSNTAWLTAIPCDSYYNSYKKASEACDRFWQAAALLPDGEYLGWQISIGADGGYKSFCFSSPGVNVTQADYNWIFEPCASAASGFPKDTPEDFFSNGRKIYMLSSLPRCMDKDGKEYRRSERFCYDDYDDGTINEDFADLLKMTNSGGDASLRILAEAACDGSAGRGMILLSLTCEISLRMKTLLSLTFGRAMVQELDETAIENAGRLPAACIIEGMTGLQQSLMRREAENQNESMETDSLMLDDDNLESELYELEEDDLELELCGAEEDVTPLDELELSIRSYNCLRRAGIHSAEQLCSMSDDELAKVKNLVPKSLEEVRRARSKFSEMSGKALCVAPDYKAMLDELIGLADVKEQVKRIISYARMKKDMETSGTGAVSVVLNMEFVGNPGTAKTTVARILAGIFHEMGLLSGQEPVEVGRADLIAEYVGQTAIKVKSVFQRAKGRLLFIDEAYSLVERWEGSYGDEAIDTIVQEMENHRSDTIVVFAGYPAEMEKLFSRNPGLRSRVPFTVRFQDYSVEEMEQITEQEAKKKGFAIQPQAKDKVMDICRTAKACANAGNGRFCRNLVENAILGYASRVYGDKVNEDTAKDFILVEEDFSLSESSEPPRTSNPIGFRV